MKKIITYTALAVFLNCIISAVKAEPSLDTLALKYGTDKASSWHHYTQVYERYFEPLRNQPIRLLEIGFWKGASIRMWRDYFPQATLFSIDIDPKLIKTHGADLKSQCHLAVVNQADKNALLAFAKKAEETFDIIIDDGGHSIQQQINSFQVLFPFVSDNGVYVIEDLEQSFPHGKSANPKQFAARSGSTIQFVASLVDALNYTGARTYCHDRNKCEKSIQDTLSYYQKYIDSVHFHDGIVFIFKRSKLKAPTQTYHNPWLKPAPKKHKGK